jgi:hypothetical protein
MVETAIKVIARRLNLSTIVESSRRRYILWKYGNDVGKIMKLFRKEGNGMARILQRFADGTRTAQGTVLHPLCCHLPIVLHVLLIDDS